MNPDLALAGVAMKQQGTWTRAQAVAYGFTPKMIRNRVETGRWGHMHRDVFRQAGSPATWEQALYGAWLAGGDGAVVSHLGATWRWGYERFGRAIELTLPASRDVKIAGATVHRSRRLEPVDRVERDGLLLSTPTRTVLDLAASLSAERLGPFLDFCLTRRLTATTYLARRAAALAVGRTGVAVIDQLLRDRPHGLHVPANEFEHELHKLLRTLGPPYPVAQHRVVLPDGTVRFLDFAYPPVKFGIEGDSYLWHASRTGWSGDHVRNAPLIAMGWRILPVTYFDVTERPAWVLDMVERGRSPEVCGVKAL